MAYVHNNGPVITTMEPEPHPAKKYKAAFITIGIFEVAVAITLITIGALSLQEANQGFEDIVDQTSNMDFNGNTYNDDGTYDSSDDDAQKLFNTAANTGVSTLLAYGMGLGVFFLITATLAIVSGCVPSNCSVIAGMVLCIFSAIAAALRFFLGLGIIIVDSFSDGDKTMHYVSLAASVLMFITAIVHSAFCCGAVCCMKTRGSVVVQQHTIQMQPGAPAPYYDYPPRIQPGYIPEYVDDRMDCKLIEA